MTDKPQQQPYGQALERGLARLASLWPCPERLEALGAGREGNAIIMPVLGRQLSVDLDQGCVFVGGGGRARPVWAVLAVHYLCAESLQPDAREVSFSYFQDCRSYLSVFGKRITARFLATSGRSSEEFIRVGEKVGGRRIPGAGTGYCFDIFPRVPISIVRYEGDEEVAAGASIIYRADAERLLPAEDRVVAAELLLDTLAGKPMTDNGGAL